MNPKVVKVELTLEDGTVMRLTGEEAEKWSTMASSQATIAYVHGYTYPELKWETISPNEQADPS